MLKHCPQSHSQSLLSSNELTKPSFIFYDMFFIFNTDYKICNEIKYYNQKILSYTIKVDTTMKAIQRRTNNKLENIFSSKILPPSSPLFFHLLRRSNPIQTNAQARKQNETKAKCLPFSVKVYLLYKIFMTTSIIQ